jgi:GWxTD domain-containing protein
MIRRTGICAWLIFFPLVTFALDAAVSHSVFYVGDGYTPSVEIYWQVNPNTLHYHTNDQKMIVGRIRTDIYVSGNSGLIAEDHYILSTVPVATIGEIVQHSIIEQKKYKITTGNIKMRLVLTDLEDSTNKYSYQDSVQVAPPQLKNPFFSDIELLDTIIPSGAHSSFLKNGQQQVPECSNFLDEPKKFLHYYSELYNTGTLPVDKFPLTRKVMISKKADDNSYYMNYVSVDTLKSAAALSVSWGSFDIAALPSGNYYLQSFIENNVHETVTSSSYFFQRMNPHPFIKSDSSKKAAPVTDTVMESVTVINLNKTFLSKYDLGEIKEILKMLIPFSDAQNVQTIRNFLKKPDEMYMRYYVYNHFKDINSENPGKAWKEFSERIIEANDKYGERGTHGYETDRGIVYLKYGQPTDIVTVENENGSLPYQIWEYDQLTQTNKKVIANAVFLFFRPFAYSSSYKLLHSTVGGEVQNTSWRTLLYTSASGGTNINSRAEQFLGNR